MNARIRTIGAAILATTLAGAGAWVGAQDSQPGQKSEPPRQRDLMPRERELQPRHRDDRMPRQRDLEQPRPLDDRTPIPVDDEEAERIVARERSPFVLETPEARALLNQATRRLEDLEARLAESNDVLLQRLGEARRLRGERQTNALFDVMQDMLQQNAEMQRYLAAARVAWAGAALEDDQDGMDEEDR